MRPPPRPMKRRRLWVAVAILVAVLGARASRAAADQGTGSQAAVAAAAGFATIFVPLTIGSGLVAQNDALNRPQAPFLVIDAGLALAPLVAHGLVGEWRRGLGFAALSTGGALLTQILIESSPELIQHGRATDRVLFGVLFTVALFSSAAGVADCLSAADRAPPPRLTIHPIGGPGALGLAVGGTL